jgi:hypothetical protein
MLNNCGRSNLRPSRSIWLTSEGVTDHGDCSLRRNRRTQIGSSDLKAEALALFRFQDGPRGCRYATSVTFTIMISRITLKCKRCNRFEMKHLILGTFASGLHIGIPSDRVNSIRVPEQRFQSMNDQYCEVARFHRFSYATTSFSSLRTFSDFRACLLIAECAARAFVMRFRMPLARSVRPARSPSPLQSAQARLRTAPLHASWRAPSQAPPTPVCLLGAGTELAGRSIALCGFPFAGWERRFPLAPPLTRAAPDDRLVRDHL